MPSNKKTKAFQSINHKLSELPEIVTQRYIYRVHKELRDTNNSAYEPKLIAIGPYHHGKDGLQKMEECKLHNLQLLLESGEKNLENYISAIEELEQQARDCYGEPICFNTDEFVEMLVLDGCFIIELVRQCHNNDPMRKNDPIFHTQWIDSCLVRDLILFENQIPFFVLCRLFDLIEGPSQHHMLIGYLLWFCWSSCALRPELQMKYHRSSEDIKHLLDLVYNYWLPSPNDIPPFTERESSVPFKAGPNFIPSATELKDANVKFQKKEPSNTFFEVTFDNGSMEMPLLNIEDGTECFFRNLIVYEQYFMEGKRNLATNYVTLLDSLINTSRDVEILSECKIIDNWLGDSETVAKIINRLADSISVPGKHFLYPTLFDKVNIYLNTYYESRPRDGLIDMLRKDISRSPWTYLSFLAAVIALVLTVVQTVCSILGVSGHRK